MVPHCKILQAIALAALGHPAGVLHAQTLCERFEVCFPAGIPSFLKTHLFPALSPAVEAYLRTTDSSLTGDVRALVQAANALGVADAISYYAEGPSVVLHPMVEKWRRDPTARVFIETSALAGIPVAVIADDVRRMWGYPPEEGAIAQFLAYFVDLTYIDGDCWTSYAACVGSTEATFKRGLMNQPHEYVRWKLGVPVTLDTDKVLDRLISDAYFTERLLKADAGQQGVRMTKDEMARLKLERDTIFKAVNAKLKLTESSAGGGTEDQAEIRRIVGALSLTFTSNADMPLLEDTCKT